MSKFRIGVSRQLRNPDGTAVIKAVDLAPLHDDPDIECVCLPQTDELQPADLEELDAAILFLEALTGRSFHPNCRFSLAARYGVGYDRIDVLACTRNDAALVITPNGVRRPVASAIITLMLALTMQLKPKERACREGAEGWARKSEHMGMGLEKRTLGSLGLGNIAGEVFRLAAPWEMNFIAHDPYADEDLAIARGVMLVGLEQLFEEADVLTINCPLNDHTRGMVSRRLIGRMKPSAFLINTARGPIVDQAALTDALERGDIAGAGLDVFEVEPIEDDHPLLSLNNVILTPHALCFTDQCMAGIGADDVRAVRDLKHGHLPRAVVNRDVLESPRFHAKLARYREQFGSERRADADRRR
ncbi:MAG: NAD(P)-dependent oxidoreductase [Gammaproteobacteria bacterium]